MSRPLRKRIQSMMERLTGMNGEVLSWGTPLCWKIWPSSTSGFILSSFIWLILTIIPLVFIFFGLGETFHIIIYSFQFLGPWEGLVSITVEPLKLLSSLNYSPAGYIILYMVVGCSIWLRAVSFQQLSINKSWGLFIVLITEIEKL